MSPLLSQLFAEARGLGFLGPGPVGTHLEHARAFADAVEASLPGGPPRSVADLGSGAGVPALVLAIRWEASCFVLVDAHRRRTAFLERAVEQLGISDRVTVLTERAEVVGRSAAHRGAFDLVTARGFGRPGVTAECAAPLLRTGGALVVSEPPDPAIPTEHRWPREGLARLGLGAACIAETGYRFVVITQELECPEPFPRRVGVPAKRPLF